MVLAEDILNPSPSKEAQTHKLKRVVQSPDSFYMDVKCPGCQKITPLFSHADTVVSCSKCNMVLSQPTGGLAKLTEGVSFRKKTHCYNYPSTFENS
ncbi:40S ribosomal protein S27-like, partial [Entomortierella chlamydospora]